MKRIKVCIIGAGNISNTRHIPALLMNKDKFEIIGAISDQQKKIDRTLQKYQNIPNKLVIDITSDIEKQLRDCEWLKEVDAVIIGTPPMQHYPMARACLTLGKHVLVEKPMMMSVEECEDVLKIAQDKKLVLYVMHSFQFSDGMMKLYQIYKEGSLGNLKSILELQLSIEPDVFQFGIMSCH